SMRLSGTVPSLSQHPLQSSLAPFHQILLPPAPLEADGSVVRGSLRLALDWLHGTTIAAALGDAVYVIGVAYVQHLLAPLLRQQQPQQSPAAAAAAAAGNSRVQSPEGLSPQEIEVRLLQIFQEIRPQVFCLGLTSARDHHLSVAG